MLELPELQPGERLDEVGIRGWRILQRADEFRFSIDAVLLAHFATVRKAAKAADLGAGTGAVGMFLLSRGAASVSGLELNPRLADLAGRTAVLNGIADRMEIRCGDVTQVGAYYAAGDPAAAVFPKTVYQGHHHNRNEMIVSVRRKEG